MKQFQTVIGIDVAKDTIVVSIFNGNMHHVKTLDYTKRIISKELMTPFKKIKESVIFVMENTGIYHANLAYWLTMAGFKVSSQSIDY
jgi:transposase